MGNLFFARSQMGMSLAFHIVFAAIGIGLPVLMTVSEAIYLRTRNPRYLDLSKRWARGASILFAVGAVSGTVLSFELGLLWPSFMAEGGAIIGMPFSLEGFAFFTEAIFLGIYLFGWNRLSSLLHLLAGVMVALSGILSGVFVVMANAWMNAPVGFTLTNGRFTDIDPLAAMFSSAAGHEILHMTLAALVVTGFSVAAVHAWYLMRDRRSAFHRSALEIALAMGAIAAPLQLISGDISARWVARLQPAKLAAMEAHYHTSAAAPIQIGGIPDDATEQVRFALTIPAGLSLLVARDPDAVVAGLEEFPRDEWPNVRLVHWSFDTMVFAGSFLFLLSLAVGWSWWRRRAMPEGRAMLRAIVVAGPLSLLALEAGWMVTELGRQPWIIYGVMRTADAVTPVAGLAVPFAVFTLLYIFLAVVVVLLLHREFVKTTVSNVVGGGPDA